MAASRNEMGTGSEISHHIWETRYRHEGEGCLADSLRRVAHALAWAEAHDQPQWQEQFLDIMLSGRFLPGGRILAGAGTAERVTLANCFVMDAIEDSIDGIFRALREGALTMQQGGGIGYDFSTLRPHGAAASGSGTIASGPVSFLHIWDRMCETMLSTGVRRGAMMATLRCDHPDIEAFIDAKLQADALPNFNLSVLVSDAFMEAVRTGSDWPLVFPGTDGETIQRDWSGQTGPVSCRIHRRVDARGLWDGMMRAAYDSAEPGVLFIDRINRTNNLSYCEHISATNPCGEIPLPPYGACMLGSLNLAAFVRDAFTPSTHVDEQALQQAARIAVRMLDNAITISAFPLPAQHIQAEASRRIGLGIMGLADALAMLGLGYDTPAARDMAASLMQQINHTAHAASCDLAREKGAFPLFRHDEYLAAPCVSRLPPSVRQAIAGHGIRNSHLTAIAPTGTISLLAGGISSGLEPALAPQVHRAIRQPDGSKRSFALTDYAVALWRQQGHNGLPPAFMAAEDIAPHAHLAMQAALQQHVDSAISKTVAILASYPFPAFRALYEQAYDLGLKGCTAYRPAGIRAADAPVTAGICSTDERSECLE